MGANKVAGTLDFSFWGSFNQVVFPGFFPGEALEVRYFEGQMERSRHQAARRCSNAGRWISLDFGVAKYKGVR